VSSNKWYWDSVSVDIRRFTRIPLLLGFVEGTFTGLFKVLVFVVLVSNEAEADFDVNAIDLCASLSSTSGWILRAAVDARRIFFARSRKSFGNSLESPMDVRDDLVEEEEGVVLARLHGDAYSKPQMSSVSSCPSSTAFVVIAVVVWALVVMPLSVVLGVDVVSVVFLPPAVEPLCEVRVPRTLSKSILLHLLSATTPVSSIISAIVIDRTTPLCVKR
jgi:hypothetical protein